MKKQSPGLKKPAKPEQGLTDQPSGKKTLPETKKILELFGQLDWNDTFDYKAERSRD